MAGCTNKNNAPKMSISFVTLGAYLHLSLTCWKEVAKSSILGIICHLEYPDKHGMN